MPKSKARKNHKQKVNARNTQIKIQKEKAHRMQREFIMDLIKKEKESGIFDNVENAPAIDGPIIDGPMINGPLVTFDGDLLTLDNVTNVESQEENDKEESN